MTAPAREGLTDIGAIRRFEDILYIRNNTPMAITLNTSEELFILGPKGSGEDIKILPKGPRMLPGFHKMLRTGDITVAPDLEDEIDAAYDYQDSLRSQQDDESDAMLEKPATDVDIIEKLCLVDGRERVFQSYREIKDLVPPLCPQHKGQEHLFIPQEKADGTVDFIRGTVTKE